MTLARAFLPALATSLLLVAGPAAAASAYPLTADAAPVQSALKYLRSMEGGDGSVGDDSITAWSVMAIAAAGQDPASWTAPGSGASPVDFLAKVTPRLSLATDWERQLMAAVAARQDVHAFGGADLVASVQSFYDGAQFGSTGALNDDDFAILSLLAAGLPAGDASLQSAAAFLLAHQGADGGWSYAVGGASDVDDTAATLMALGRLGVSVHSPPVQAALHYLHAQQLPDGGLPSVIHGGTVSNTASDSWAIEAIVLAGQDPTSASWSVAGHSLVANLRSLQQPDGSFSWDGVQRVGPVWMTAYAVPALLGQAYPVVPGNAA